MRTAEDIKKIQAIRERRQPAERGFYSYDEWDGPNFREENGIHRIDYYKDGKQVGVDIDTYGKPLNEIHSMPGVDIIETGIVDNEDKLSKLTD